MFLLTDMPDPMPPASFSPWLASLAYAMMIVGSGLYLFRQFFKPQHPPNETLAENVHTIQDRLAQHESRLNQNSEAIESLRELMHSELSQLRGDMHKDLLDLERRIADAGEARAVTLHNRMNALLEGISKVQGQLRDRP